MGFDTVTLTADQLPSHSHEIYVNNDAVETTDPENNFLGKADKGNPKKAKPIKEYTNYDASQTTNMSQQMLNSSGGNGAHINQQPFLSLRFCIALLGIFPSRN